MTWKSTVLAVDAKCQDELLKPMPSSLWVEQQVEHFIKQESLGEMLLCKTNKQTNTKVSSQGQKESESSNVSQLKTETWSLGQLQIWSVILYHNVLWDINLKFNVKWQMTEAHCFGSTSIIQGAHWLPGTNHY